MTTLNKITDNPGARKSRIRVGRGIGSTKGQTGGRGVKGQKSRTGVAIKGYEGGQMPIHMRLPKRGFKNPFRLDYNVVNLDDLQAAVDAGKLDAKAKVDVEALVKAGVLRRAKDGVRLLGRGELKAKLALEVAGASEAAKAAVEKAGGSVTVTAPAAAAAE
jgi:large subunit ribosomal protein L15